MKKGDKVICINNSRFENSLTIEKTYDIINVTDNGELICVMFDNNHPSWVLPYRFLLKDLVNETRG